MIFENNYNIIVQQLTEANEKVYINDGRND